jgi:hypothetical protein
MPTYTFTQSEKEQFAQVMAPALQYLLQGLGNPRADLRKAIDEISNQGNELEVDVPSPIPSGADVAATGVRIRIRIRIRLRTFGIPSMGLEPNSEIVITPGSA